MKGANCQGEGGQPLGAPESAPSSKAVELSLCSSEFRSCVKVEVAVWGFPSLINLTVSVDVKQHRTVLRHWSQFVPNMSTDIRGHEALHHHHLSSSEFRSCVKVEVDVLGFPPSLIVPSGLCGREATLNLNKPSELRSCVKVEVDVLGFRP